jgi:hypothetical protein
MAAKVTLPSESGIRNSWGSKALTAPETDVVRLVAAGNPGVV